MLSNFHKLEGVYVPATSANDIPIIGINANRPITRQRFTAAHELCLHFRDAGKQISCPIFGKKTAIEYFADGFAAAILMPIDELRAQVKKRKNIRGNVSFDDVLKIADYFGVSFESCLFRLAYRIHAIDGDTESASLKKRIAKYAPDKVRKSRHMTYANLYAGLIDNYREQLAFSPTDHARYLFQNGYIYNDSRMEGLDVTVEQASEIVTDLRLNMQNSCYCNDGNEAYLSIAGHCAMYQDVFAEPIKESISIYDMLILNKKLFSYYPYPEFGGSIRQNNTLVLGAKFETVDYNDIFNELAKVDNDIKYFSEKSSEMPTSEFVKHVARIHHRITVIHPFPEGNGRTSRAFMNVQFVRAGLPPIYIEVEDKPAYIDALSLVDKTNTYDELYEIIFRMIIKSHVALNCL
ncbi:MAG: ImmA/IrrE family metallo-endopeptidase [Clostridiaceae bacterium]|nr:ImmA/IrrE family metallo-endopeptidase [Clostridiaceae bacterium]